MLRPFLRVARPDDWTGTVARLGVGVGTLILLLAAWLATLPQGLVELAGGRAWAVRGALVLVVLWLSAWGRAVAYGLLPRSPVLLWGRLTMPVRGKKVVIPVRKIVAVHVERRPEPLREVFVVELADGAEHDLCPVHWSGAARLYHALARKIA